jgi:hypothetical protein
VKAKEMKFPQFITQGIFNKGIFFSFSPVLGSLYSKYTHKKKKGAKCLAEKA